MPQDPPRDARPGQRSRWVSAAWRGLLFLLLWLVVTEGDPGAVVPGLGAAAAATWASLRLLPRAAAAAWPRPLAALRLALRFLNQSVLGGVDVARRALSPRMRLSPGFVQCRLDRLPPGPARHAFAAEMSLLPGTLGAGLENDTLILHCLEAGPAVIRQAEEEQALLAEALGAGPGHG